MGTSKMKKKKSRVQEDDVQGNQPATISRMQSNSSPDEEDYLDEVPNDNGKNDKKKGRGDTKLRLATPGQKPIQLLRNEYGQPVGSVSIKYSSFLGTLTKEFVSYTLKGWDYLDEDVKKRMWDCLKAKYDVQDYERKTIFQHVVKLWRNKKSKLRSRILKVHGGKTKSRDLSRIKPAFMDQNQWNSFVKETLSPKFQEVREKYIQMRAKQTHNHTTSRRGYARLGYIMKQNRKPEDGEVTRVQVWVEGHKNKEGQPITQDAADKINKIQQCPPESQNTNVIAEDALSIVFGKEARGSVRGMGFGVTPSKVGAQHQNNTLVKELQNDIRTLNGKYDELKSMFLAQASGEKSFQEQGDNDCVFNDTGKGFDGGCVNGAIPQSNQSNMPKEGIRVNTECKLLNWLTGVGVVAEGRIASIDPKDKVHFIPLGASCWKVWVDRVMIEDFELLRPNDEMTILDHARGSTIAWPSMHIILDD